jgi:hypothetical protein
MNRSFRRYSFTRYPFENDPNWKYAWVADTKYIDSASAVSQWLPIKGNIAWIASGTARPTWALDWGSTNRGSITHNGTTQRMTADALAAVASAFAEYTILVVCKNLETPIVSDHPSLAFSHSTTDTEGSGFTPGAGAIENLSQSTDSSQSVAVLGGSATDNNRHVFCWAFKRATSPNNYLVQSGVVDSSNSIITNNTPLDYTSKTMVLDRCTLSGFRGSSTSQFYEYQIRAVLVATSNLSAGDNSAGDSMMSAATYFANELA